jgi:hypothetical protein
MGTNFYTLKGEHIGKRSAAGEYCWDCGITLCKGGNKDIHYARSGWYDSCPKCGKKYEEEGLDHSSAGRELGFNKDWPQKKTGVKTCSSFTWAIHPINISKKGKVKDEYGREFSYKEFLDILKECPVQFFDSIGQDFS